MNYYNENDPTAVAWLLELVAACAIPYGIIDTRSIADVAPGDLCGFTQCHFFAGIGGWPLALSIAGWPEYHRVWTGSCPCQPFSTAGKRRGVADERHLWPELKRLIAERKPPIVIGEQVASKDGRVWLSGVRADLEGMGYAVGAADLCAAGAGAPHIRQRLFWLADSTQRRGSRGSETKKQTREELPGGCEARGVEHANGPGSESRKSSAEATRHGAPVESASGDGGRRKQRRAESRGRGVVGGCGEIRLADGGQPGLEGRQEQSAQKERQATERSCGHGAWAESEWLQCSDGKQRRTQPGIHPLAHGVLGRVGLLRGYGNAIVPQVAAEFVMAFLEVSTP